MRDYEEEAKAQGWNPDPESMPEGKEWVDAQTFVEKGEKISGILKSKLERIESRLEEAERANKEFGEYSKSLRDRDKQKAEERISQLEAELAQAVTDGDGQAYTKVNQEISRERQNLQQNEPNDNYNKFAEQWLSENQWYNSDQDLQIYADGLAERVASEGYTGKAYFNELTERVKARYPEKFERKRSNGVEAGGEIATSDEQAKTYDNLPSEAKQACDRFESQGLMTRDEYVASFEWDE